MQFSVTTTDPARLRAACIVVAVFAGGRHSPALKHLDAASGQRISALIRRSALRGKIGQSLHLHDVRGIEAESVLVVGCGRAAQMTANRYLRVVRAAAERLIATGVRNSAWALAELEVESHDIRWSARQSVEVIGEAAYRFDQLKSKPGDGAAPRLRRVSICVAGSPQRTAALPGVREGKAFLAGVCLARDLGNLPANICTPGYLADSARELAKQHANLKTRVLGEADMKKHAMGALLSVTAGTREPARLVIMEYRGGARHERPVALVGKGVTFDSGGISIKPSGAMDEMKFDMCGAASVLGAIHTAATLGLAVNVVGILPATENLPDGNATKPGDVITSMSGQTIEVLNTDAEGRLILCDALTFAARYEPDTVVDIATLTGACVVALGAHASGLFANDEALAQALLAAGQKSGDRAWQMPLWEEYEEQLKSNFADIANVGGREAGAVTAAGFLSKFTRDYRWAHLDIAGTAWRTGRGKGATGRPVKLLAQYLMDHAAATRPEA